MCGSAGRRGEDASSCRLCEIGVEPVERVAQGFLRFAHHRGAHHHAENVEGDLGAVPVGVHHPPRLENAVVVGAQVGSDVSRWQALTNGDAIVEGVAGFDIKRSCSS